jgi:hypothetical protein
MAIDIAHFTRLRPYSYHVTARENLPALSRAMQLFPAATLMRKAGRADQLRWRRSIPLSLSAGTETYTLKDQAPLLEVNVSLGAGWAFGDFVEYLNEHVFFWPGTADGPIGAGVRLLARYEEGAPAVLQIPTAALLEANSDAEPLFCPFNSGTARQQQGRRVLRDSRLFRTAADFPRPASQVVELVFRSAVLLPAESSYLVPEGWERLRDFAS